LIAAVESVFIPATEALAEVVVVVGLSYIIAAIAVVRVPIGIRVLIVGPPAILTVGLPRLEAFLITIVHCLPKQIYAVLICLVVAAAKIVTIGRCRVEVGITIVIVIAGIPETDLLLLKTDRISLLKTVLRRAVLLL